MLLFRLIKDIYKFAFLMTVVVFGTVLIGGAVGAVGQAVLSLFVR